MSEERLIKIIARLEGKIMDLEEALDRARANTDFWYKKARNGEQDPEEPRWTGSGGSYGARA